ncbi:hypothetical protein GOODEAATRI_007666, partial [Goodea atripinnis]
RREALCTFSHILTFLPLGFDLMEYFNVKDILGTRVDESQSSYVRLGTMPVSIRLDGENKAVEYNAVGLTKDAVRAVFKNPEVDNLFDRNWHKIGLSVEARSVALYLDCKHIQTLLIEDREDIDIQGKTVIGKRLYDSVPIDVRHRFIRKSSVHCRYFS